MLTVILGGLGSGKTLLMTIIAITSKRKFYSNFKIDNKNYNEFNLDEFSRGKYSNSIVN